MKDEGYWWSDQMKEMWKCMILFGAGGCHPAAPASPRPRLSPRWLWSRGLQACLTALQVQNCTDMIWGGVGSIWTNTQVIFSGQEDWRSQFCVLSQALKCSRWTLSMFMFKTSKYRSNNNTRKHVIERMLPNSDLVLFQLGASLPGVHGVCQVAPPYWHVAPFHFSDENENHLWL